MKKRDKVIAGLIIGGAIGSVLGVFMKNSKKSDNLGSTDTSNKDMENLVKPKRKGVILRLLDWLEKKE